MSGRSNFAAHRPRVHSQLRRCPRDTYPDHDSAARAARRLRSYVAPRCGRCGGFHLTLKGT